MDISVIIPTYKRNNSIFELITSLRETLDGKFIYEIIFISNGGLKENEEILKKLENLFPVIVRCYYRKENLGQHKAILEGIKFTNGKYIVTMDDDLQHNPVYIPLMFAKLEESNYDVIYARFRNQKHSLYRNYLSKLFRVFLRLVIPGLYPCYSSYRIIRRNMALKILDTSKLFSYPFIDGLITRVTRKINHIDASHFSAREINSTYSYTSLIKHAFMITINYSPIFNPKILFLKKVDEI